MKGMSPRPPHEWEGVSDSCWPAVACELPPVKKTPFLKRLRRGCRPRGDDRPAFGAILWRLRCGGTWDRLPERFGSAMTARRRLAAWTNGLWLENAWRAYLREQSPAELASWRDAFLALGWRRTETWRFFLELIWRREFAPPARGRARP